MADVGTKMVVYSAADVVMWSRLVVMKRIRSPCGHVCGHGCTSVTAPVTTFVATPSRAAGLILCGVGSWVGQCASVTNRRAPPRPSMVYGVTMHIDGLGVKITRIAQGVPMGGDIEYFDPATLLAAMKNRREL